MKKVLGISFGRNMQRCELMVKEALFGAEEKGAEVRFISTVSLEISHCRGCGACGRSDARHCVIKDDYRILEEAVLDADAVIIAAPVYSVGITGQFKNFVDRFGAAHDRASVNEEQKRRDSEGEKPLDPRLFKKRYIAYISVGGAKTHNWVSMGLPMLHLFDFSTNAKVVGQIDAYDQGRTGSPILDRGLMKKCRELGAAVADSVGLDYDKVKWYGEEGVCPVCHCDLIEIGKDGSIECPVCGIRGKLTDTDGKITADFSDDEKLRARGTMNGLYEHFNEIRSFGTESGPRMEAEKDFLDSENKRYRNFKDSWK